MACRVGGMPDTLNQRRKQDGGGVIGRGAANEAQNCNLGILGRVTSAKLV